MTVAQATDRITAVSLDEATILAEAGKSGRLVVTAENASIMGGLGEAVASTLLRNGVTPTFRQIALPDAFLDAGALPTLHDRYGISRAVLGGGGPVPGGAAAKPMEKA